MLHIVKHIFIGYYLQISMNWKSDLFTVMDFFTTTWIYTLFMLSCFNLSSFCQISQCASDWAPYLGKDFHGSMI